MFQASKSFGRNSLIKGRRRRHAWCHSSKVKSSSPESKRGFEVVTICPDVSSRERVSWKTVALFLYVQYLSVK